VWHLAAGFYTYSGQAEIFNVLGKTAYHEALAVIAEWGEPTNRSVRRHPGWVGHYFDYMDTMVRSCSRRAHSAPDDDDFRNCATAWCPCVVELVRRSPAAARIRGRHRRRGDGAAGPACTRCTDRPWPSTGRDDRVVAEMIVAMATPLAS